MTKDQTLKLPMHKHLNKKPKLHPRSLKMLNELTKSLLENGLEKAVTPRARARMLEGLRR